MGKVLTLDLKNQLKGSLISRSTCAKKTGVTDDVINRDKTEYSSHALAEVGDGIYNNE